ncbi:MAG: hypothetical protein GVY11_04575 [Gammaproteobacteria bacterium]|jgi:predicted regulator of Ras-like GTPase activity (Roadblock/LC7/MglB family)|nr:hypothetical protein [Gammaproteobacteria bacterium]
MEVSEDWKQAAGRYLDELIESVNAETSVVLASEDGMELLSRGHDDRRVSRMSAMSSSMTALGVMAGEECDLGGFRTVTLELEKGFMLMFQITTECAVLILGIIAERRATVGQVLHHGKRTADRLAAL